MLKYQTRLFYGLPAVLYGDYWIIFSPYAGDLIRIPKYRIEDPLLIEELGQKRFFGNPSEKGPGALSEYFQLTLITTSDCNLRCRYCFANAGETRIVMSKEVAFAAVKYAIQRAKGRGLLVSFFGGEPSLTPSLIKDGVLFVKDNASIAGINKVRFNITTNGIIHHSFLHFLVENDFFFTISMDGLPLVQNYQRPLKNENNSSGIVEQTIRTLVGKQHEFIIRATVTDFSVEYLVPTINYLNELGVKQFHCEAINLAGRAILKTKEQPMQRPLADVFAENLKAAIIKAGELGMGVLNSSFMNLFQPSVHFCDGVGGKFLSLIPAKLPHALKYKAVAILLLTISL